MNISSEPRTGRVPGRALRAVCTMLTGVSMIAAGFAPVMAPMAFAAGGVVINEFSVNGSEWVELYNASGADINLSNWHLEDTASHTLTLSGSLASSSVAAFDFPSGSLNDSGDTITLLDGASTTVDSVAYGTAGSVPAPDSGQSAGRAPDGSSNWVLFKTPSKGASNGTGAVGLSPTPPPFQTVGLTLAFTAQSSDLLAPTYSVSSSDPFITAANINSTTGAFSWTPNGFEIGPQTITVTAASGSYSESTTTAITVRNISSPFITPALSVGSATAASGGPITLSATFTASRSTLTFPVGSSTVAFRINGVPAGVATTNASGVATLTFTPSPAIAEGFYPGGIEATAATSSVGSAFGSADLTITAPVGPPASVTAEDFGTWDNPPAFKAINVGFRTADFTSISNITVDLYRDSTLLAENTATPALIHDINTGGDGFTQNGQLSTSFITSGTLTDTYCAGGPCWNMGAHTWGINDKPTKAVITVEGTDAKGNTMQIAENDTFVEGAASFPSIISPAPCNGSSFDSDMLGSVNAQGGWSAKGSYDQAVVDNVYGFSGLGCKVLRMSNAVTGDSLGNQTFSPTAPNEASSGSNHLDAQFDIASTMLTQQPGLELSVSLVHGKGDSMSYLRFSDQADGIHVFSDDGSDIATLSRTAVHSVKFSMDFKDGANNDTVGIYIDGDLVKTSAAGNGNNVTTVDSLLFRSSGTSSPANQGKGFLFDNVSLSLSTTN